MFAGVVVAVRIEEEKMLALIVRYDEAERGADEAAKKLRGCKKVEAMIG